MRSAIKPKAMEWTPPHSKPIRPIRGHVDVRHRPGDHAGDDPAGHGSCDHPGVAMFECEPQILVTRGDQSRPQTPRPVLGASADAVVDRGDEEMLVLVDGFDVEGGGLVIAQQQPLLFQRASDAGWRWRGSGVGVRFRFDASAATDRPPADCHRGCTPETCHWTCPDCAHGCATAPPRLTSQKRPGPPPVLSCSLCSRLQIASDRSRNVRVRTDNEPDNDHTNTSRTTQIGRLFLLSFVGFGRHPPRGETCGRRPEPVAGKARRVHGEPMSLRAS